MKLEPQASLESDSNFSLKPKILIKRSDELTIKNRRIYYIPYL